MIDLSFNLSQLTVHPLDSALEPYNGQIVYDQPSNKMKVYVNGVWEDISTYDEVNEISEKYPTICPNCGAPHNPSSNHCEYCDTYFK